VLNFLGVLFNFSNFFGVFVFRRLINHPRTMGYNLVFESSGFARNQGKTQNPSFCLSDEFWCSKCLNLEILNGLLLKAKVMSNGNHRMLWVTFWSEILM
jgi:hypothetical protein